MKNKPLFMPVSHQPFLGIGEGKRKKVVEEQKRQTMQLETDLALVAKNAGLKTNAEVENEAAAASSSTTIKMIAIIAVVIVIIVISIFIFKKK